MKVENVFLGKEFSHDLRCKLATSIMNNEANFVNRKKKLMAHATSIS